MLDEPAQEMSMSRFPFAAAALAALLVISVTACDDSSDKDAKPRRSTTTTSSSTSTTTTTLGEATGSTTTSTAAPTTPAESIGTCGGQTDAIVAAIGASEVGGLNTRAGQYTVKLCRLAPSSPIWAAAEIVPNPGVQLDRSMVLMQRIGALWNVTEIGTSRVGCDEAPMSVLTELEVRC
jgi:hypothetical protein